MTTYARITATGEFDGLFDLTPEQYAALQANGKATYLRIWVVDPQPVPTATQVIINAGITIGATEVHQTWGLRDKTQIELNNEQNAADRGTIVGLMATIVADIDAFNANPDVSGTAVERLTKIEARVKDLERQQRRDNRILLYFLRGQG